MSALSFCSFQGLFLAVTSKKMLCVKVWGWILRLLLTKEEGWCVLPLIKFCLLMSQSDSRQKKGTKKRASVDALFVCN